MAPRPGSRPRPRRQRRSISNPQTSDRRVIIIAGPNGAGKTTFAGEFLLREGNCPVFVNADLIAAGLSPFDPAGAAVRAARLMIAEIRRHIAARESFALETTLAGLGYARSIPRWQQLGYRVELFFLDLPDVQLAIARVKARVALGGHNVPRDLVQRRYVKGRQNFDNVYKPIVNRWEFYDNSGVAPVLRDMGENS